MNLNLARGLRLQLPKTESLESLRSKIASGKCPCRGSQISEVMIRFSGRFVHPTRRGLCPVTEKTIFKKSESDQPVTRFECENFSLNLARVVQIETRWGFQGPAMGIPTP